MAGTPFLARRAFLARAGVLGAVVAAGGLLPPAYAGTRTAPVLPAGVDALRPVLRELARDTMNGLCVFVVPGPDAYSRAQGTPRTEPGAMEAKTPDFMMQALDDFVPFPDEVARPIATAFATGLADSGIALPAELAAVLPGPFATLDAALGQYLRSDEAIPLSLPVALALNLLAAQVDPASVRGPFVSPFARLSYARKAEVFALLEHTDSDLVALLDARLPEPLHASVSGLLKFVGGALLEFPAFGSYSEWGVFDRGTRSLRGRPVGWELTGYQPRGPMEGWDEFKGYYQHRTRVSD
jgi:hypothetical protein